MLNGRDLDLTGADAILALPGFSSIIHEVLDIALRPLVYAEQLEHIIGYLANQEHLGFSGHWGVFGVDMGDECLRLSLCSGFLATQRDICAKVPFGVCHCGQTFYRRKPTFFSDKPPQRLHDEATAADTHYCLPVMHGEQVITLVILYMRPDWRPVPTTHILLETISRVLALVFDRRAMDQQLIELVNDLRDTVVRLRGEKAFSESIIQGLDQGLIVVDSLGKIEKHNAAAARILGSFGLLSDGNLDELLQGQLPWREANPDDGKERECSLVTAQGEHICLRYCLSPRGDREEAQGWILSLADITELCFVRKEMEKMNRLSTVAEIAAAVAHEVRNPLAGIKIMAQSIEEEAESSDTQKECSRRIVRQVDRLNELLTEFFSYARPRQAHKRPASLATIIAETTPLISATLFMKSIRLVCRIPDDLPDIIADSNQVQQVLLNILLNAMDAVGERGVISLTAQHLTAAEIGGRKKDFPTLQAACDFVMLRCADNGRGMSPAVMDKVFEPFFTTKKSGTGLGMSIVYRTLLENDAQITVESQEGEGSAFTIFFQTNMTA
ncbi:MAG: PAS domain-containing protein [Desulfobulbaceae bacterium]|nr:PAS domain-containing protein [Desulfobulbaceae bacterium]